MPEQRQSPGAVDTRECMSEGATIIWSMTNNLDLDDAVAVANIVEAMLGRPLTPNESSRLKSAFQRSESLPAFARAIAA